MSLDPSAAIQAANTPLGTGDAVVCDRCNASIPAGDLACMYLVNYGDEATPDWTPRGTWCLDCGVDAGDTEDDACLVVGTVVAAPEMRDRRPSKEAVAEESGVEPENVIQVGGSPAHRLAPAVLSAVPAGLLGTDDS